MSKIITKLLAKRRAKRDLNNFIKKAREHRDWILPSEVTSMFKTGDDLDVVEYNKYLESYLIKHCPDYKNGVMNQIDIKKK
jgi:hypothetical protein